ncbi:MAG: 4-hydroxythreonine-4-phosphate dehydrogenase PdxA [Betaproteobacteria bacterium]
MSSTASRNAEPSSVIAVTTGEPAGVGPELCATLAAEGVAPLVLIGDRDLLEARAAAAGVVLHLPDYDPRGHVSAPSLLHVPLLSRSEPGRLDSGNSGYVLALLERAADGCRAGEFAAMVTAPVHKGVILDAGFAFTGHTEYLAERCRVARVVMMLVGGGMRVALVTTHLPLKDVPSAITIQALEQTLRIVRDDLRAKFGIADPRLLVAGLNPHAGESGHMGREEIEVIEPALERLRTEGFRLEGPLPADTLFQAKYLDDADAVVAMYHDQGLPVLKYASFGTGVNVTLGLPIIRTSVDHGTALDLAGTGRADAGSLRAAVDLASELVARSLPQ